ncbi:hypothetical protein G3M48_009286 [Beauveria asiatica]|uniref:Uncharacterized protein n=1 Tax=Beauveria asiatica TaxID=1069075 RepID=A0AAW0RIX2_9HYPO
MLIVAGVVSASRHLNSQGYLRDLVLQLILQGCYGAMLRSARHTLWLVLTFEKADSLFHIKVANYESAASNHISALVGITALDSGAMQKGARYALASGQKFLCICLFGKKKIEHQAQAGDKGQKGLLCANANLG